MKKKVTLICPKCRYGDDYYVDEYEIYDSSPENPYKVKCHHCKEEWEVFHVLDREDFNTEIMGELPEE